MDKFKKLLSITGIGWFLRTSISSIQFITSLFVKKRDRIILACPQGTRYGGNIRFLFEYLIKNNDSQVFLLTTNKKLFDKLNDKFPDKIIYGYSWKALKIYVSAKSLVLAYGKRDFYPFQLQKSKFIIHTGHGIPLKKMGLNTKSFSKFKSYKMKAETKKIDLFLGCSELENTSLAKAYGVGIEKTVVTGFSRNDFLINQEKINDFDEHPYLNSKIILYAPTYRNNGSVGLLPFKDADLNALNAYLVNTDTYLLIRKHHAEWYNLTDNYDILADFSNIKNAGQSVFPEIQTLFPYIDILLTDYSGLYFDFLLLNRPLLFSPFDYEAYNSSVGFAFDYESFTPGPKVFDQKSFINEIDNLRNGIDLHKDNREKVKRQVHKYLDGNSSQRILDLIKAQSF